MALKRSVLVLLSGLLMFAVKPYALAQDQDGTHPAGNSDAKPNKELSERIAKAAAVLEDLTSATDKRIPGELLDRAQAVAVIPNMIQGAFGLGGRYGKGVVSQRLAEGRWSAPIFIEIGGGSFGAQIGVSSTDLVMIFTDRKALGTLEGGRDLKLGVDANVVAGPVGRSGEVLDAQEGGTSLFVQNDSGFQARAAVAGPPTETPVTPGQVEVRASVTLRYKISPK